MYTTAVICTTVVQLISSLFLQIFSTTLKDNLKTNLFTKLMGLSCAIEKQIIFLFCVWLRARGHPVHNWWTQALMTTRRIWIFVYYRYRKIWLTCLTFSRQYGVFVLCCKDCTLAKQEWVSLKMVTKMLDLMSCWQMPVSFEPCVFCLVISREKECQFKFFCCCSCLQHKCNVLNY